MAVKKILEEISTDVADVIDTDFNHVTTKLVPSLEDSGLTFERGAEKKGKLLKTCVLFVDIRDSVALTEKHHNKTMGKVYTAFTKAVLKAAHHHGGFIRNIIGDRVMVVFPEEGCFTKAVDCAISINHICKKIIDKKFRGVDFKCGIGIDYGELRVIKVGVQKQGEERSENKGLVWVGYPANLASRLTDKANKKIEEDYFEVTKNPTNPEFTMSVVTSALGFTPGFPFPPKPVNSNPPQYLDKIETVQMTPVEFANSIYCSDVGELSLYDGRLIKSERKKRTIEFKPILMSEAVFNGYKKANPDCNTIKEKLWKRSKTPY